MNKIGNFVFILSTFFVQSMKLLTSEFFHYKNGDFYCENVPISSITNKYGTPIYIYSKNHFKQQYLKFADAFKHLNYKIYFAAKSNFNLNVIKIFSDLGAGIDVNSDGELFRALKAGVEPKNIIFTGIGKTKDEIKSGLENNVSLFKAESEAEINLINKIANKMGIIVPLAIRVNPDVNPKTHPYISTGLSENKFGIDSKIAKQVFVNASKLSNIKLVGIDMHIGSQIVSISPFVEAVNKLAGLFLDLKKTGIKLTHFDIGGGMGVVYNDEKLFTIKELAEALTPTLKTLNCKIMMEPGRYLTANGGTLITKVLYTKKNFNKNFIIVDAAITDLLRPSIYDAYHHIQPIVINNRNEITADIVGPVCESGDFLAKNRKISDVKIDEQLAIMSSGAYTMVMASNYNARRKAPEVLVDNDKYFLIRSRETYEYLLFDEKIIDDLHK